MYLPCLPSQLTYEYSLAIIKRGMDAANFSSYNRTVAEAVKKGLKAPVICEVISKCKARNISWQQYRAGERELKHGPEHSVRTEVYAEVFKYIPDYLSYCIDGTDAGTTGFTRKN